MPQQNNNLEQEIYTATTDGVASINLPALQGCNIIRITREIKTLATGDYTWNAATATLILATALATGESLFILYLSA